ncbi:Putative Stearoyl-CoA desaturase (Delta-9 desaturase) [Rhizopus microsporus]|nr:Putative Stearoyl-CoA desaturase (Delta-9 desaturase) [Rhizopus microsporus]
MSVTQTQVVVEEKFPPYAYTETENRQPPMANPNLPPLFDEPTTLRNFTKHVNWFQTILLTSTPLLAIYSAIHTPLQTKTFYWSILYYFITALGITAGYHRYWAHRSYNCTKLTQIFLCLAGSGAFEGSIQWWSRGHRAHHRWTDSDKDPYAAPRGFFFSHIGWMLVNRPKNRIGYADTADLRSDPLVQFQHRYYLYFATTMSFLFPALVAGFGWGDFKGGLVFAGLCRLVFVHHATFCVNSLAHYIGDTPYDDYHTPKNSWITALVTCGEGYHNFHHEFPQDYRNAILWYQYDPTKWFIRTLNFFGLTYGLKTFPSNEIEKGRVQMMEKKVNALKSKLKFGSQLKELPVYSIQEVHDMVATHNKRWVILDGMIYDVENFDHPGGCKYLEFGIGKDMTKSFNGGIYNHSNAARNLLSSMRVGVLQDSKVHLYGSSVNLQAKANEYDSTFEPNRKSKFF